MSLADRFDFAVIGGGLAGSATAIHLRRAGARVCLVDKMPVPRDKLCGEFLSPESRDALEGLGLLSAVASAGAPSIERARFAGPSGATAAFSLPGAGLGLSRRALDALLWRRAEAEGATTLTAEVHGFESGDETTTVHLNGGGQLHAQTIVAAHGRHRRVDRSIDPAAAPPTKAYAAFKRHHRARDPQLDRTLEGHVEIHVFSGGYCGMSHVEDGVMNVCCLLRTSWLKTQQDRSWTSIANAMADAHPVLADRLSRLAPLPDRETLSVAAIDLGRMQPLGGPEGGRPVFRVGDAAAVIPPLVGDGQAMALEGARHLAHILVENRRPEDAARAWHRTFRRTFTTRMRIAGGLQAILWRPGLAEGLVRTSALFPAIPETLARWTRSTPAQPSQPAT